ncbi:MAG: Ig-like domain-containing protein, partial [Clostridia bacterium]|nr:Ig-like domain-containing protein [Clostridia bacterium]
LGDGSAVEANIFSNCYAVAAENFALMTYGGNRTVKDFTEGGDNGNLNFASIYDLFDNPAARALAEQLGVSLPTVTKVTVSQESLTLYVDATANISATATAADGETVGVTFAWTSSDENIATVENGEITGISAGTVTITATYGDFSATCTVTVTKPALENLVLEDFSYAYNGSEDFVIESQTFPEGVSEITAKIKGTDGSDITLTGVTLSGNVLTIPAAQFNVDNMPTKTVEMSLFFDGDEMIVEGVYLVYTVNTADEYMTSMIKHLTRNGSEYDGSILIGADLDFTGKSFANAADYPLFRAVFNGELDGGNHVLSNITMSGSASGAVCGTLNGTVKNLVIKNATLTIYGGIICDLNYGVIESCYVQGSIPSDGVATASDNFGAGLLAGRLRNNSRVVNCIVELSSKGATNVAGAFGKLGDGSAAEARIFENCYAVAADGFAIMTYGSARTNKNFDENNGNKNFATIFDLFEDETAGALAEKLGLEEPVITRITLSATELTLTVNGTKTVTASAYTADNAPVAAPFAWSSSDEAVATVENGVVKGIAGGTVTITVSFGNVQATCTVTVSEITLDPITLTGFSYAYNGVNDFVIENEAFPAEASEITATVIGMDGGEITLTGITLSGNTLTIPAAQFNSANMPTKSVQMTLYFDGVPMTVNGVYLIYTINNLTELQNMKSRLTADFDGHLLLGADIDFTGVAMNTWAMKSVAFKGIFDGGLHTISNITYAINATACGLLGNIQAGAVARNIIMTNLSINSYSGGIAYLNYGTVENCYVKGELVRDGLNANSAPGNFGCGLLVGRSLNASAKIENCIVEMTGHGEIYDGTNASATIYGGAAFGMMGAGVTQAKYTNCYAVNADGITLCSNSKPSVFSNFTGETCGNFETMTELLADETAGELAASLGLTA